ncbi:YihY/virulence factor BrkB family protein [Hyphococcus sp.]|uniref:YihY/virulence factor BrkB family protein n=1 Tax=Hyphococcus sp. TaxID=2038636 RepID=UPI003D14B408
MNDAKQPARKNLPPAYKMLTWRHWKRLPGRVFAQINNDRLALTAAGIAFYALLAIFPGIAVVVSLWGLIADPIEISQQIARFSPILPSDVVLALRAQAIEVAGSDDRAIGLALFVSLSLTLFSASRAIKAIMMALNIVYDEKETRNFLIFNIQALAMTFAVAAGFIAALAAVAIVPIVFTFIGLGDVLDPLIAYVRWPILFAGAWLGIAALYKFAPARESPQWQWISPGAGAAVVLWIVASVLFSVYVQNFADYNETYGSIGAIIVLMMWFWVSAFVFLVGAEIDSEIEQQAHLRHKRDIPEEGEPPQN